MSGRPLSRVVLAVSLAACRPADAAKDVRADSAELARREARLEQALAARDSGMVDTARAAGEAADSGRVDRLAQRVTVARWILPHDLAELSGLALTPDARLLTHSDERAQISEIDYRRGVVTKQFVVGTPTVEADLEGIAVANDAVFLLASNGTLYEFREGANGARVDYMVHDTRLGKECEFEGLAFDPAINSLLLACKTVEEKNLLDSLVIYRWKLQSGGSRLSRLTVPLSRIPGALMPKKTLHPSDITIDPLTGNYVIVASIENVILSITPVGDLVFARPLPPTHEQAESVAITKDGILIVGDEASRRRPAVITLYSWP